MDFLHALILGVVEGITEFLPISSTGHLTVTAHLLQLPESEFVKSFEVAIQLGAILSVVLLYWRRFFLSMGSLKRIIAAFIPTAVLGAVAYPFIKQFLLGNVQVVLGALFAGGIALIICEKYMATRMKLGEGTTSVEHMSLKKAALVGLFQTLAFIPGVSRAGATIIGGMFLGISRATIAEFSFLLAVPTMAAATGLDLLKTGFSFSSYEWQLLIVGLLTSFVVALAAIKLFIKYVQKHTFIGFGIYRIVFAIVMALILL